MDDNFANIERYVNKPQKIEQGVITVTEKHSSNLAKVQFITD